MDKRAVGDPIVERNRLFQMRPGRRKSARTKQVQTEVVVTQSEPGGIVALTAQAQQILGQASEMRAHPIGTGPFKFVEFRPNEYIRVTRNPDYWKPGRPYLDGIEWPIVPSLATRILGFVAGTFD